MERDCPKELHNGDFIAFLPNDVIFQVKKKESNKIEIKSKTNEETEIEDKEKNKVNEVNEIKAKESNRNENSCHDNDDNTVVDQEKETLEVGQLLKKTRNLPSWMKRVQGYYFKCYFWISLHSLICFTCQLCMVIRVKTMETFIKRNM